MLEVEVHVSDGKMNVEFKLREVEVGMERCKGVGGGEGKSGGKD